MNKISNALPRFYPQSWEGRKTYSVQEAAVRFNKIEAPRACIAMPVTFYTFRMPIPTLNLRKQQRITPAEQPLQAKKQEPGLADRNVPAPLRWNNYSPKVFSSRRSAAHWHSTCSRPLSYVQWLDLSILSPGGTQCRHVPVQDADMQVKRTGVRTRRTIRMFNHWHCQQQAIPCMLPYWRNVYCSRKPILPQRFFDHKAAFKRPGAVFLLPEFFIQAA